MARVLRNRNIVIAEDETAITPGVLIPDTGVERTPMEEIETNDEPMTVDDVEMEQELKGLKAAYKTALNGNKKRKPRKGKKQQEKVQELEVVADVVQDEKVATLSEATEIARETLSSDEDTVIKASDKENAPPSPAVRATRQQLAKQQVQPAEESTSARRAESPNAEVDSEMLDATEPRIPEDVPLPEVTEEGSSAAISKAEKPPVRSLDDIEKRFEDARPIFQSTGSQEDSFVAEIVSRSPSKPVSTPAEKISEDSFVEHISSRSPSKHVSRIEDSVEALDKLEEALEALDEAANAQKLAPVKKKTIISKQADTYKKPSSKPVTKATAPSFMSSTLGRKAVNPTMVDTKPMTQSLGRKSVNPTRHEPKMLITEKATRPAHSRSVSVNSTPPTEASASTSVAVPKRAPVKRPTSLLPPKQPVKSAKPPTKASFELPGEAIARKLKEQREARLAEKPSTDDKPATDRSTSSLGRASSIRSSKPVTQAKFELPGEALSRRKREAHEMRLKALEEEDKKRRQFKAKPVRTSVAPSTAPRETAASLARKSQIGLPKDDVADGRPFTSSTMKRTSVVGAHRPSILVSSQANVSAPRSPGPPAANTARKVSATSMSGLMHKKESSVSEQRTRAKEIYNRDMKTQGDVEKEKREREERARKSREEAAERGREASRKWAEQQKARKALEGDKGLDAGFGPGGQMGLKAA